MAGQDPARRAPGRLQHEQDGDHAEEVGRARSARPTGARTRRRPRACSPRATTPAAARSQSATAGSLGRAAPRRQGPAGGAGGSQVDEEGQRERRRRGSSCGTPARPSAGRPTAARRRDSGPPAADADDESRARRSAGAPGAPSSNCSARSLRASGSSSSGAPASRDSLVSVLIVGPPPRGSGGASRSPNSGTRRVPRRRGCAGRSAGGDQVQGSCSGGRPARRESEPAPVPGGAAPGERVVVQDGGAGRGQARAAGTRRRPSPAKRSWAGAR